VSPGVQEVQAFLPSRAGCVALLQVCVEPPAAVLVEERKDLHKLNARVKLQMASQRLS